MNLTQALKLVTRSGTPKPEMEELTIWEQHTITLSKDSKMGFGFAISGGRDKPNPDSGDTAVIVSDVVRNGPAMGRLFVRDQIVMVNGVSMDNVYSTFTIQNLKSCGKIANITVKRPRTIQIPATTRPVRATSQSNLLDQEPRQRTRRYSDGSDQAERYRSASSTTLDRNGTSNALPVSSGYKRLPRQDFPDKPIKTTLLKKKLSDEYGLKLGSQIFIKHMTATGLASKEGTLQEGDLILKINGMTTENLSLLETKHLVEKSRGKLTMTVLRDDRKFLVSIPEVEDSEEDRNSNSSSELDDISDLDTDLPTNRDRVSRSATRERRTRRRAEPPPLVSKSRDPSPVRSTLSRPAKANPPRRAPSESESDRSPSPPPSNKNNQDYNDKYRSLSGMSILPNPKASPASLEWAAQRSPSSTLRPRKVVSESDSDRSASPPPDRRGESHRVTEDRSRYKVLPDLPLPGPLRAAPIVIRPDPPRSVSSPVRIPPPDSDSESDSSAGIPQRQGTPHSQDTRNVYRATPLVDLVPQVESPKWKSASVTMSKPPKARSESESESEASYASVPRPDSVESDASSSRGFNNKYRVLPELRSSPVVVASQEPPRQNRTPSRRRSDSSESGRVPSPPRRSGSTDVDSNPGIPRKANGTVRTVTSMKSNPPVYSKTEEPIYSLPPDSIPTPSIGYSADLNTISFVKDRSVGLRLVGGNDVGIFVGGVQPKSPAQLQGMKEGDQIMQVNEVDFGHLNREEAALFLMNIQTGERVEIRTQNKMDIYKKILQCNLGDSFYIRTHFDHEADEHLGLSFTRGEVFRVVDTMHKGKLGKWQAIRMGNDLHELDKGTIPNQAKAETLASIEQAQRASGGGGDRQVSGPRAEFWKLRGLRGAKKNVRRTRDDLLQLTIQGKFPAYERVLLREANFKRPIVILGPLNDVAMEKLVKEMPDEYEVAEMVPRSSSGTDSASTVIKLDTVRSIAEKNKHPLLDITPTAVERLNYIQYHPMVLFLDPHSRKDVKAMRQRLCPKSNKSSRRLYAQALKMRKHCNHLFAARIDLQPSSNVWYDSLKDKIRHQQAKPVWVSEVTFEGGGEEELDALDQNHSDYLSAASDLEDTDGEAFTDGEIYTDNEDLEEPFDSGTQPRGSRPTALARSSEPASEYHSPDPSPEPLKEVPPLMTVPEPRSIRRPFDGTARTVDADDDTPSTHSFSDSDFDAIDRVVPESPSDAPPNFIAPDPRTSISFPEAPSAKLLPESPPAVTLSVIEKKLQQTRMAEPEEKKASPSFIVLAHHQAVQTRRSQIRGSDSSDDNNEAEDFEWGPATEL